MNWRLTDFWYRIEKRELLRCTLFVHEFRATGYITQTDKKEQTIPRKSRIFCASWLTCISLSFFFFAYLIVYTNVLRLTKGKLNSFLVSCTHIEFLQPYISHFFADTHTQNVIRCFIFLARSLFLFVSEFGTSNFYSSDKSIANLSTYQCFFVSHKLLSAGNRTMNAMVGVCCISGFLKNLQFREAERECMRRYTSNVKLATSLTLLFHTRTARHLTAHCITFNTYLKRTHKIH